LPTSQQDFSQDNRVFALCWDLISIADSASCECLLSLNTSTGAMGLSTLFFNPTSNDVLCTLLESVVIVTRIPLHNPISPRMDFVISTFNQLSSVIRFRLLARPSPKQAQGLDRLCSRHCDKLRFVLHGHGGLPSLLQVPCSTQISRSIALFLLQPPQQLTPCRATT
jgi:hypothetical protein